MTTLLRAASTPKEKPMLIWLFLQLRLAGRPVLTGVLLMGGGLALVIAWTVTGAGLGGAILARVGILLTLSGAVVTVRAVSRGRRQHTTRPPGGQDADPDRR
jgi:hypothetical protein